MDKYENFIQTVNWSVREEPAVKIFSVDLSQEIVDEVNEYIDNNTIPNNINYAANLAGQLKENEKSAQLDFDCSSGVGLQLKDLLDTMATAYLQKAYSRISKAMVSDLWTNHAYAGDYNPFHEHATPTVGGLSGFMWLGLPKIMEERRLNKGKHQMDFGDADGQYDGWTHMVWGLGSKVDLYALKMGCEEYVQPEVGVLYIFPKWLHHQTLPFFGEGERRSIAMNWAVMESEEELKKIMSPAEYEDFKSKIPEDVDKSLPYQTSIGGALLSVKLDD
jgi:hypothetical protein